VVPRLRLQPWLRLQLRLQLPFGIQGALCSSRVRLLVAVAVLVAKSSGKNIVKWTAVGVTRLPTTIGIHRLVFLRIDMQILGKQLPNNTQFQPTVPGHPPRGPMGVDYYPRVLNTSTNGNYVNKLHNSTLNHKSPELGSSNSGTRSTRQVSTLVTQCIIVHM
jgi:hypothetical protein